MGVIPVFGLVSTPHKGKMYQSSPQSVADDTTVQLNYNTIAVNERNVCDTANNQFLIPSDGAGDYFVMCKIDFVANTTGRREVWIEHNGDKLATLNLNPPVTDPGYLTISDVIFNCVAGDIIDFWVRQTSTGALNLVGGEFVKYAQIINLTPSY